MEISSAYGAQLASLQSAISMVMLDKALSADAQSMTKLLADFAEANPTPPPQAPSFGHVLDILV